MYFNFFAGIAAAVALLTPVLLILAGQLFKNGSLLALLLYYLLTSLYVLTTLDVILLPPYLKQNSGALFHYLDAPLMLVALLFFCNESWKQKLVLVALSFFCFFEILIAYSFGLDERSSLYVLGPGILIILGLSFFFFAHYGKMSIVQGKGTGKTFMLVAILFSYVLFLVLYYLHYLMHTPAVGDVFLIYYIGLFLSAIIMSIGLVWIIKRNRELKELQLTRRELALFFDS